MDTNQDGQLTRDEWKGQEDGFLKLDHNSDGIISREEMTVALSKFSKQHLRQMDLHCGKFQLAGEKQRLSLTTSRLPALAWGIKSATQVLS